MSIGHSSESILWPQVQFVGAEFTANGERFGNATAISNPRMVIGAPTAGNIKGEPGTTDTRPGQAFVYVRDPASPIWTMEQRILATDRFDWDQFGGSLAISGDRIVVGATRHAAPNKEPYNAAVTGAAYIFDRDPTSGKWAQTAELLPTLLPCEGAIDLYFGQAVAVEGDRVVVSAYKTNCAAVAVTPDGGGGATCDTGGQPIGCNASINDNGSAYIYERQSDGSWPQVQRIQAADPKFGGKFGVAVSMVGDQMAIGAYNTGEHGTDSGSAYIFERDTTTDNWNQTAKIVPADGATNDIFGVSVSLQANRVLIGARDKDSQPTGDGGVVTDSGGAYVFERQTNGTWTQTALLQPPNPTLNLRFGVNVALSGDTALIGAFNYNDQIPEPDGGVNVVSQVGGAYVYGFASGAWTLQKEINPTPLVAGMGFGTKLALDGNQALVGAFTYFNTSYPDQPGAAFTFESSAGIQNGAKCANDGTEDNPQYCLSGICSPDHVCCDAACTGTCESCLGKETGKTDGTCAPIPAGQDPDSECPTDDVKTCGHDGFCDGTGACRAHYALGTPCGATTCVGGIQTGKSCNGGGTCASATIQCDPFACDTASCKTTCTVDEDCAPTLICRNSACVSAVSQCGTDGTSVLDSTGTLVKNCSPYLCTSGNCGERCTQAADCQSGFVCDRRKNACIVAVKPPVSVDVGCSIGRVGNTGSRSLFGAATLAGLIAVIRRRRGSRRIARS
jgi:hypothetical protein